jgi:hypothetical protein
MQELSKIRWNFLGYQEMSKVSRNFLGYQELPKVSKNFLRLPGAFTGKQKFSKFTKSCLWRAGTFKYTRSYPR